MKEHKQGYVYVLTNPSFRENWVKIGKSIRPVDVRSKELDNTAVPLPFEIYATLRTEKYNEVEKMVHKMIDRLTTLRVRKNREFFNVSPEVALDIFRDIASTIDDAVVTLYRDNKPVATEPPIDTPHDAPTAQQVSRKPCSKRNSETSKPPKPADTPETSTQPEPSELQPAARRTRFRFSMCGIGIGEQITFVPTKIVVRVATDNMIEHEGRLYKLSPFVGTFMPETQRNTSGAYQGAKFFTYKGRILDDIRKDRENGAEDDGIIAERTAETAREADMNATEKPNVPAIKPDTIAVEVKSSPVKPEPSTQPEPSEPQHAARRAPFRFSMCGIGIGEQITFVPTKIVVRVATDNMIEHEGRLYKLSPFVAAFLPEAQRNTSGAYQGAKFFTYKGRMLDNIRKERENGADDGA